MRSWEFEGKKCGKLRDEWEQENFFPSFFSPFPRMNSEWVYRRLEPRGLSQSYLHMFKVQIERACSFGLVVDSLSVNCSCHSLCALNP